jgi:hypothetical protein
MSVSRLLQARNKRGVIIGKQLKRALCFARVRTLLRGVGTTRINRAPLNERREK